ncbi:hypothetical protein ACJJTC_017880 [Scirpophaga incertulas]
MDVQPGPSNIQILPQINLQPESITINTSTSDQIDEPPEQSATNQDDVSQAAFATINSTPKIANGYKTQIRKTAVLTDTSEKNALAEEQIKNEQKTKLLETRERKTTIVKEKVKAREKERKKLKKELNEECYKKARAINADEDLEWYCTICCDSYSNSAPREQRIECSMCKNWAHVQCINETDNITYVCPNCKSDEEFND